MSNGEAKILVVDDNPATLYATSRVLRAAGFSVLEAVTGGEAIARAADEGPDLVILDVNLPDLDGFQVCRHLRAREQTARTPVIHLSATFVKDVDKVQGLDAGADGYLTHPVEPPVLVATVNAFLRARQAEDAMRRSEARFKAVFELAPIGIALLSDALIYLEANPAMCHLLGRTREEVVAKHLSAFTPKGRDEAAAVLAGPPGPGGTWRGTFPLIAADGRRVDLEWAISTHSVPGVRLAVVTDVTERQALEAERARLLASEQGARAEAERAGHLKDEFLATLSHELRTPLNAILGWAQILMRHSKEDAELNEGLAVIERNARAQAQLIEDLLDMSRIVSGKLRLDVRPLNVVEVIAAAIEGVTPAAEAKGVRLQQTLDPHVGPVRGDPARLQQVVWNLLTNAIKFTPRGGRVQVLVERVNSHVEITVSDTGRGIKPEFLPYVFDRFRQADGSTTRQHTGLGLGLAIVKQLVEMHGGTVRARSPGEGQGATFSVELPLVALDEGEAAGAGGNASGGGPGGGAREGTRDGRGAAVAGLDEEQSLEGVSVLVVDDERDARELIRRVIEDAGGEAAVAGSADEAMEILTRLRPAVLVSDVGMPAEDGYSLLRRVRGLPAEAGGDTPAAALTAFARSEDRLRALRAGFQTHVAKPVEPVELIAVIASLAGRRRSGGGAGD